MDTDAAAAVYRFAGFTLDLARGSLLAADGAEIALRPKAFALLRHLVEHPGRLIDRDELMRAVWPGVVVTDDSITQCVKEVRRALDDAEQRLLRTLPRRGYLWAAETSRAAAGVGRSTTDLLATLRELEARRVSLVALNGMAFDRSTPHGRMMATVLAGIAEFERELTQERIRSGIAAAKARCKKLGREPGQRPKSDRLAPKVLALLAQGRSYRLIGREVGLSKNTAADIVKRSRAHEAAR